MKYACTWLLRQHIQVWTTVKQRVEILFTEIKLKREEKPTPFIKKRERCRGGGEEKERERERDRDRHRERQREGETQRERERERRGYISLSEGWNRLLLPPKFCIWLTHPSSWPTPARRGWLFHSSPSSPQAAAPACSAPTDSRRGRWESCTGCSAAGGGLEAGGCAWGWAWQRCEVPCCHQGPGGFLPD